MYPSSLRTTSLNSNQLNAELAKRGAKTFGSMERKQQRLQRFIEAEQKTSRCSSCPETVSKSRCRKNTTEPQPQERLAEVRRSTRISALLREYLGY